MSDAPTPPAVRVDAPLAEPITVNGNGSLGLVGVWKAVANLSAAAILAGSFLYLQNAMLSQAREDRVLFREELRMLRADNTEDRKVMHALNESIRSLTVEVQKASKNVHP